MKIGILTFHRATNYGAVLQCFALQECLKAQGHYVRIIDYRPEYIEKYRRVFSIMPQGVSFIKRIGIRFIELLRAPLILHTNFAFNSFLSSMLQVGKTIKNETDLYGVYDAIFIGSDQVWSPSICNGFDPIYYGQFPHKGTRLVSYAASLGGHNVLNDEQWGIVYNYLKSFDFISVRENILYDQLRQIGIHSQIVVDPSMLLSKQILDKLAIKPNYSNYVLLFMLEEEDGAYDFAQRIASQIGSKVIRLQAVKTIRRRNNVINVGAVTPQKFCGFIKYAKCIVNISFHGTAFSILYNKPFYTLHSSQEDRAANLLNLLGLEKRLVSSSDTVEFSEIDYVESNKVVSILRQKSLNYICQSLE